MTRPTPAFTMHRALGRRLRVGRWHFGGASTAARPLLVFNGIGMNLELLAPLAEAVTGRPVISFDMPGIGKSPDPVLPYNAATMAMTASVLLDKLGIDHVDVLGISWGGGIAQQFALQHRPRVGRLVLAATSAGMAMAPANARTLARLADPREYAVTQSLQRSLAFVTNGGGDGAPVSLNAATSPSTIGWLCQLGALAAWSSVPMLPLIDRPTLICTGDDDHVVPPLNSRFLHALIPGSRLRMFPGGGHLFMLSHRAEFVEELERFLAGDDPARAA